MRHALYNQYRHKRVWPVPIGYGQSQGNRPYPIQSVAPLDATNAVTSSDIQQHDLVMGHLSWQMVTKLSGDFKIITMLRHPVEQLISEYRARHQGFNRMPNDLRRMSFEEYAESKEYTYWRLNRATQIFSGKLGTGQHITGDDVRIAKNNLTRCIVGLHSRYEDSIMMFNRYLGSHMGAKQPRHNKARTPDIEIKHQKRIEYLQRFDMGLYDHAKRVFEGCFAS